MTESWQGDVFLINFYQHKLKHIIFWHSCACLQCERTNVKYVEANSNTDWVWVYFDIFNVSPLTLKKGTGVPENYVF